MRVRSLHRIEGRECPTAVTQLHIAVGDLDQRTLHRGLCVVDDDVQAAERLDRAAEDSLHLIAATDVTFHRGRGSARSIDRGRDGLTFREGAAGDRNAGAVLRQCFDDAGADALSAAGDKGDLAAQPT
jgi:hypothetical protein